MRKIPYEKLGLSGLNISRLSLGTYRTVGFNHGTSEIIECFKCAVDNGINFFDTADSYADGDAEKILGKSLSVFPRGDYVISTKSYFPRSNIPSNSGLSRKHIFDSVNKSLSNLNLDYIDLFYFHRYDQNTPLYESMNAISDLIRSGKVLYWGVSRFNIDQVSEVLSLLKAYPHLIPPLCNQWYYNLLSRDIESSLIDYCVDNNVSIVAYSILGQGFFCSETLNTKSLENYYQFFNLKCNSALNLLNDLSKVSMELDITISQLAIIWVLYNKKITSAIFGARNKSQLIENIASSKIGIDEVTYQFINETVSKYKKV